MTQPPTGSPSGSKNHRTPLYCRQADSAAAGLGVPGKTVRPLSSPPASPGLHPSRTAKTPATAPAGCPARCGHISDSHFIPGRHLTAGARSRARPSILTPISSCTRLLSPSGTYSITVNKFTHLRQLSRRHGLRRPCACGTSARCCSSCARCCRSRRRPTRPESGRCSPSRCRTRCSSGPGPGRR